MISSHTTETSDVPAAVYSRFLRNLFLSYAKDYFLCLHKTLHTFSYEKSDSAHTHFYEFSNLGKSLSTMQKFRRDSAQVVSAGLLKMDFTWTELIMISQETDLSS